MNYKLQIDPQIIAQFPKYNALVIYAQGLNNQQHNLDCINWLQEVQRQQQIAFQGKKSSSHPHIDAWVQAYKQFGAKPSKYRCSVEALLKRVLKGHDLSGINPLVDLYNAISLAYVLPIGGEDWDYLSSNLVLTLAKGKEPFDTFENGKETVTYPEVGEVIWLDSTGVTCRRWNWRQCRRTQIKTKTCNAYFVLDCLPPYSLEELIIAGEALQEKLKLYFPNCTINYEILNANYLG